MEQLVDSATQVFIDQGYARTQMADTLAHEVVELIVGCRRRRGRNELGVLREIEVRGKDAGDRGRLALDVDHPSDRVAARAEERVPEAVADHDCAWSVWLEVAFAECPAEGRCHAGDAREGLRDEVGPAADQVNRNLGSTRDGVPWSIENRECMNHVIGGLGGDASGHAEKDTRGRDRDHEVTREPGSKAPRH